MSMGRCQEPAAEQAGSWLRPSWGHSGIRQQAYRPFHQGDIDSRVAARAMGAIVEQADDGEREDVLDAGDQVALASDSQDSPGPDRLDDLSRERAAGHDGEMHAEALGEVEQVADVALAASLAVVDLPGDLVPADVELDAVRSEDEDAIGGESQMSVADEVVRDLDERSFDRLAVDAGEASEDEGDGEQQVDGPPGDSARGGEDVYAEHREHDEQHTERDDEDGEDEHGGDDDRQPGVNSLEAGRHDQPQAEHRAGGDDEAQGGEPEEQPLAGTHESELTHARPLSRLRRGWPFEPSCPAALDTRRDLGATSCREDVRTHVGQRMARRPSCRAGVLASSG